MAKSNVRGLARHLGAIREALEFSDEQLYLDIGNYVAKRIVQKARMGKRMYTGEEERLKPLKESTIKNRKRTQARGEADPEFFSPARSNLTETGQYLASIKPTRISKEERTVTIEPTGSRRKEALTNKELAKYLSEGGRNIFGIDGQTRKIINQMVLRQLRKQIRAKTFK